MLRKEESRVKECKCRFKDGRVRDVCGAREEKDESRHIIEGKWRLVKGGVLG